MVRLQTCESLVFTGLGTMVRLYTPKRLLVGEKSALVERVSSAKVPCHTQTVDHLRLQNLRT